MLPPMLGQLWLGLEPPEEGVVEGLLDEDPVDGEPLEVDPLDEEPLEALDEEPVDGEPVEVEALVVWAIAGARVVVVAVAAETPRPRLRPRAPAAIPAATKGCFSFIG